MEGGLNQINNASRKSKWEAERKREKKDRGGNETGRQAGGAVKLNKVKKILRKEKIGSGMETDVYRVWGKDMVLKDFAQLDQAGKGYLADEDGFNDKIKRDVEQSVRKAKELYGKFVAACRIVENPEKEGRYFLLQSLKGEGEENTNSLFDYFPADFDEDDQIEIRADIVSLADKVWENYRKIESGDKTAAVPDLNADNILLETKKDGREKIWLIDYSLKGNEILTRQEVKEVILMRIVMLYLLGGEKVSKIKQGKVFPKFANEYGKELSDLEDGDEHELYNRVRELLEKNMEKLRVEFLKKVLEFN